MGDIAPDFRITDYAGAEFHLSNFRGRPVLLNFFCGCDACARMAPHWEKLHRDFPAAVVLGISSLGRTNATQFRRRNRITFPLLFDPDYETATRYGSEEYPRTWLIDASGRIVFTNRPQDDAAHIDKALRQKINEEV